MESGQVLEELFDRKKLTVIRHFLKNPAQEYYLKEVSKSTRIPLASMHRILNKLVSLNILKLRKIKAFKLYSWNDNDKTKYLQYIMEQKKTVLDSFVEKASRIGGITAIILHGDVTSTNANLLIIGENIDDLRLRELVVEAKEASNFSITHLTLTPEQFNQMSAMGLYPKKKTMLYEK